MSDDLRALMVNFPREGKLEWIGLRPRYRAPVESFTEAQALADHGLVGDHAASGAGGKRQVTLIQREHLYVIAQLTGRERVDPALLRRNLVVSGINLLALRDHAFAIGAVVLIGTGPAAPCARMEEALGSGGFNALRGHGGITARVVTGGMLRVGDAVRFEPTLSEHKDQTEER
jgi:MOSC domain-containing protein YiiM